MFTIADFMPEKEELVVGEMLTKVSVSYTVEEHGMNGKEAVVLGGMALRHFVVCAVHGGSIYLADPEFPRDPSGPVIPMREILEGRSINRNGEEVMYGLYGKDGKQYELKAEARKGFVYWALTRKWCPMEDESEKTRIRFKTITFHCIDSRKPLSALTNGHLDPENSEKKGKIE